MKLILQLVLPDCKELPIVGSSQSYNCVRLGMPNVSQLIRPHSCYTDNGQEYRFVLWLRNEGRFSLVT